MKDDKIRIKLILLGDSGVGKSSIIQRYYENKFDEYLKITQNANYVEKELTINDNKLILELWDTAGQEEYRSLTKIFVKNSKIIILVYSVISLKSFDSLNFWYDYIKKENGSCYALGVAGNKTDLIFEEDYNEEVSQNKAEEFAKKIGANFALVSAKESANEIVKLINELISKYLEEREHDIETVSTMRLETRSQNPNQSKCCFGKSKKIHSLKMMFLGCKGVGKTSIIKAIKGKDNIINYPPTKSSYIERLHYNKNGEYITVELKDTIWGEINLGNFEQEIKHYRVFFLVFDIYKEDTLYALEDLIKKLSSVKYTVYLLGYNNESEQNKNIDKIDFDYGKSAEILSKKYGCEYEYITIEDIYKIKDIIIENINCYFSTIKN